LNQNLDPVNYARAKYVPEGNPFYIESRDARARWFHPAFIARCQIFEQWFRGRIVASEIDVKVEVNLGEVVECAGTGGGGWGELEPEFDVYGSEYDPYSGYSGAGADCSIKNPDDDGGTPGSGIPYQPGDYTGGETVDWQTGVGNGGVSVCGQAAKVEYICIDTSEDGTHWVEYSCGYATTC
jgi:hypothetical protein